MASTGTEPSARPGARQSSVSGLGMLSMCPALPPQMVSRGQLIGYLNLGSLLGQKMSVPWIKVFTTQGNHYNQRDMSTTTSRNNHRRLTAACSGLALLKQHHERLIPIFTMDRIGLFDA